MTSKAMSPNHREAITAISSVTGQDEYLLSTNGALNTTGGGGGGGGTQYSSGTVTPTPVVGNALIFDNSGTLQNVSIASPLPVLATINGTISLPTGAATSANQTNGTQQTKLTNGTNIADVAAGDVGFNGVVVNNGIKTVTYTTSATGAQTLLANTDVRGYSWMQIVHTSVGGGLALTAQLSNVSGGTYINYGSSFGVSTQTSNVTNTLGLTANVIYEGPTKSNFFQIAISAMTSGTTAGYVVFFAIPRQYQTNGIAVNPISATGSTVPSSAYYMGALNSSGNLAGISITNPTANTTGQNVLSTGLMGQFDDVSPTAITENNFGNLRMSTNRNAYTTIRDAAGNERGVNVTAANELSIAVNGVASLALADGLSNPTVGANGSYMLGYNGASWERLRVDLGDGSSATGLLVNNSLLYNGATYDRQRGDTTSGSWVNIKNGLMPAGTALNTYSVHLTTNATTTPTSSTAYISAISISNEVGGTTSTVTIQDKQGTPLKLVNGVATTALTTTPTTINFQTPVKMVSGIDIITAGAVAATIDVWINYYQ